MGGTHSISESTTIENGGNDKIQGIFSPQMRVILKDRLGFIKDIHLELHPTDTIGRVRCESLESHD